MITARLVALTPYQRHTVIDYRAELPQALCPNKDITGAVNTQLSRDGHGGDKTCSGKVRRSQGPETQRRPNRLLV